MIENIEKNVEYIGYVKLYYLFRKLYFLVYKWSQKLGKFVDKIYFEQYKMKFGEQDTDIYIVAYPKSGTTMLQMILYHLTTNGDMNFSHIYDVSPSIRNAAIKRQEVKQYPAPRIIKSHDFYDQYDKTIKGRFIFVYRDGMDVAVSFYHQNKNYNKSDLEFDKFLKDFLKPRKRNWFNYCKGWFDNKNKFPVLYIKYEDLLENKEKEIYRIIDFCKIEIGKEGIKRAIDYSSFDFMKQYENKFGEQPDKKMVYNQFIRQGKNGEGKQMFSPEQEKDFLLLYNKIVKSRESKIFTKLCK